MAVSSQALAAFNDHDVALLAKLADFLGVAVGLAGDLGRVQSDLLLFGRPSPEEDLEQLEAHDRARVNASRFVMNVLRPEAVFWMESRRRVQAVLDNPDQLAVVFQPIVELSSNAIVAVEALAGFRAEPARGPDAWFAEAELAGIGVELELLAVAKALVARRLLPNDVALTINVGARCGCMPRVAANAQGCRGCRPRGRTDRAHKVRRLRRFVARSGRRYASRACSSAWTTPGQASRDCPTSSNCRRTS